MQADLTIIILNWNGWNDTIECLESLYQINYPNYNVIVVDNGSEDESIKKIKDYCNGDIEVKSDFFEYNPKNKPIRLFKLHEKELIMNNTINNEYLSLSSNRKLILINNDRNYGYAKGNNIGIKFSLDNLKPDYILLLNNDVVVDKNFLQELVGVGQKNNSYGILGPKIYYYNEKNKIQATSIKLDYKRGLNIIAGANEIDEGYYDSITQSDYISGACMLIKSKIFSKSGLLDSSYFCYWEETDFCIKSANQGYYSYYVPTSIIWHKTSKSVKNSGFYSYYYTKNMFKFIKKHQSISIYLQFLLYFCIFRFWKLIFTYFYLNKDFTTIKCFLKGVLDGIR